MREIVAIVAVVCSAVALSCGFGAVINVTRYGAPMASVYSQQPDWINDMDGPSAFTEEEVARFIDRHKPAEVREPVSAGSYPTFATAELGSTGKQ